VNGDRWFFLSIGLFWEKQKSLFLGFPSFYVEGKLMEHMVFYYESDFGYFIPRMPPDGKEGHSSHGRGGFFFFFF